MIALGVTDRGIGSVSAVRGAENLRASLRRGQGADGTQEPAGQGPVHVVPSLPPRAPLRRCCLVLSGKDGWLACIPLYLEVNPV